MLVLVILFIVILFALYKPTISGGVESQQPNTQPSQVDIGRALTNFVPIGQTVNVPAEYIQTATELGYKVADNENASVVVKLEHPITPKQGTIYVTHLTDGANYSLGAQKIITVLPQLQSQIVKCGYINQRTEYNKSMRLAALPV